MNAFFAALPAALGMTLTLSLVALVIGALLAFPLMLARVSKNRMLSNAAKALIEVIRCVPPVVWVFVIFFGIQIGTFRFSAFATAIIAFAMISAAYIAEIYRGGFIAVKAGQFEAASALGLGRTPTFVDVVAPQMMRVATPGLVNYTVGLLKDTSIVSIIGVTEIVMVSNRAMRATGDAVTPFLIAAALYLSLSVSLGLAGRRLYKRLQAKVA
jgi:polar amino acid transport system permease protein